MEILFNIEIIVDDEDIITSRLIKDGELVDIGRLTAGDKFRILAGLKSKKNGVLDSIKNSTKNEQEPIMTFLQDVMQNELDKDVEL